MKKIIVVKSQRKNLDKQIKKLTKETKKINRERAKINKMKNSSISIEHKIFLRKEYTKTFFIHFFIYIHTFVLECGIIIIRND